MSEHLAHAEDIISTASAETLQHAAESEAAHEGGIHVAIAAEKLGEFLSIPITNTLITSWVVIGILLIAAFLLRRRRAMVPSRFQTLIEEMVTFVYDYIAETL